MTLVTHRAAVVALAGLGAGAWLLAGLREPPPAPAGPAVAAAGLPAFFVENRGQADSRVAYYAKMRDSDLYFTPDGYTLRLSRRDRGAEHSHAVRVTLVDAHASRIEALEPAPGVVSYFKGPASQWRTGLPASKRIGYAQPWPGIDLAYRADAAGIESIYTVAPHADPGRIRLRYAGQESLSLDAAGNLVYGTSLGAVTESAPVAYQDIAGERVPVGSRFTVAGDTVGIEVAAYDPGHALVIDPRIEYAGFIGGADVEQLPAIAVDADGSAYITGATSSTETSFPSTVGPDTTTNGNYDVFVAKISADGSSLVYCGYLGGASSEFGHDIAVDAAGAAYVTGYTGSTGSFPATVGPDLSQNGGIDAFVAKLKADGTGLVYAGFIGGSIHEMGNGIAVDAAGNAYVVGETSSFGSFPQAFPASVGPDLSFNGGATDAFIAKVKADGTGLVYAGFIGGDSFDHANAVAVDTSGAAYVVGVTRSTESTFPVGGGPELVANGEDDAFVAKVKPDGSGLVYSGFLGGIDYEYAAGVAVDSAGNAYVAGGTRSEQTDFPTVGGPGLIQRGAYDAYVTKLSATGTIVFSGFVGGSGNDGAQGIALDSAGNLVIAGNTTSTNLAVSGGLSSGPQGGEDAFVAKVKADGSGLLHLGYFGGSGDEWANDVAVDGADNIYVTGQTESDEASLPVRGGPDLTYNGGQDVFVARIAEADYTPGAFTFTDASGVTPGAQVTSNTVTISGIDNGAPVKVTGGSHSIGCTATFTSAPATINAGQTVCVRHTASTASSGVASTVLYVGDVGDTFTSTALDYEPAPFSFVDVSGVARNAQVTSAAVTITGIAGPAPVSVAGGDYSIGCNGTFTAANGTIANGQQVCVRHMAAAEHATATGTILTVGGVSDTFTSTTAEEPADGGGGAPAASLLGALALLAGLRRRQK